VVTGTGAILTATPDKNPDLYWALAGGGGGTYGVVLSMTVRLHKNMPTAGATLSFTEPSRGDAYWEVVEAFLVNLPAVLKEGATIYWQALPGNTFFMPQSYLPNGTAQGLELLLQPTLRALNQSEIPYGNNCVPSRLTFYLLTQIR
jgi:FAD/FMN-containing dehydrogenase